MHIAFHARRIGCEPRLKHHVAVVEIEVHRGEVDAGRLVNVDVEPVGRFELQRGLHTRRRESGLRRVGGDGSRHLTPDFAHLRDDGLILLRVVVTGNPVGRVIARHGKLRVLLLHHKVVERLLLGKLVAQSHAVVVDTKTDKDVAVGGRLAERDGQFVVVIADGRCLAPHGFPSLVKRSGLGVFNGEAPHEVGLVHSLGGVLGLGQFQSETRRLDHRPVLVAHLVGGHTVCESEFHGHIAVGRHHRLGGGRQRQHDRHDFKKQFLHDHYLNLNKLKRISVVAGQMPARFTLFTKPWQQTW